MIDDWDAYQEGKRDNNDDWIRCRKCDRSYSIEEWQRDLGPLGPDTDFVCQECRIVDRRKENNEQLDAYHPDRVPEVEYL